MKSRTEVQGRARVSEGLPAVLPEMRHEVWTQDPAGDLDGAFFDLPTPVSLAMVQKGALDCWRNWVEMKAKEHCQPVSEPQIRGPFRIPDYDQLDMARYYMVVRWRRTKPLLITLDEASEFDGLAYPSPETMYRNYFANLGALSRLPLPQMEREAKAQQEYVKRAEEQEAFGRELERRLKGA